jgi:hypothetical protein
MAANISQVIRAAAAYRQRAGIFIFLDMDFVESSIIIIFYTKGYGTHQFIMFQKFNISNSMDLFTPPDDLIGSVIVYKFQQV